MRLFLAINLPADVRRAAFDATRRMRDAAPALAWAAEARIHLTLKFLGEQPERAASSLAAAMDRVANRHRRFDLRLGGVGAFPNFRHPRVVWLGVAPDPRLELLHHDIEVACEALGFALDGRAFRPHVTLARARNHLEPDAARRLARAGTNVRFDAACVLESVDLMRSVLGAKARYERMHAAALRPG